MSTSISYILSSSQSGFADGHGAACIDISAYVAAFYTATCIHISCYIAALDITACVHTAFHVSAVYRIARIYMTQHITAGHIIARIYMTGDTGAVNATTGIHITTHIGTVDKVAGIHAAANFCTIDIAAGRYVTCHITTGYGSHTQNTRYIPVHPTSKVFLFLSAPNQFMTNVYNYPQDAVILPWKICYDSLRSLSLRLTVKQCIYTGIKNICQFRQQHHIRTALIGFPLTYSLICHTQLLCQRFLRNIRTFSIICNFISKGHSDFLLNVFCSYIPTVSHRPPKGNQALVDLQDFPSNLRLEEK